MTDEWEFRTARGRGEVGGGALRVENTPVGIVRKGWTGRETRGRLVYLFTTATTLAGVGQALDAGRRVAAGTAEPWHALLLAALAFVGVALVRKLLLSTTVPLRRIRSAARVDDDRIRVTYDDEDAGRPEGIADLEIETLTREDADEVVELLELKGVRVEDSPSDAKPASRSFRERLAEKVERER